jgi:ABC-type phosphate transport system substrate-binding protein
MRTSVFFAVALAAAVHGGSGPARADGVQFRVIVNPANPTSSVERRFLADAFFKKTTRWSDDEAILPVDLGPGSPVRRSFSDEVMRRSVAAVKSYWQQMVFSGHGVPPAELDSDGDVVRFVVKNRGAVGYVSAASNISGVKILVVR